jgi:hypothetical protein
MLPAKFCQPRRRDPKIRAPAAVSIPMWQCRPCGSCSRDTDFEGCCGGALAMSPVPGPWSLGRTSFASATAEQNLRTQFMPAPIAAPRGGIRISCRRRSGTADPVVGFLRERGMHSRTAAGRTAIPKSRLPRPRFEHAWHYRSGTAPHSEFRDRRSSSYYPR